MTVDNDTNNIVTINLNDMRGASTPNDTSSTSSNFLLPYSIEKFNGVSGLPNWGFKEAAPNETCEENWSCNTIAGSFDGGIFPRNLKENTSLRFYRRAFCRPVDFVYSDSGRSKHGFNSFNYRVLKTFLANPDVNPDNKCYCRQGKCLPSGFSSLAPCYYRIPITISQPHFLNADPEVGSRVVGMNPVAEQHDTFLKINPEFGIPLSANLRIQINLDVPETRYNHRTAPFNNMMVPMFWLELNINDIPRDIQFYMSAALRVMPVVQEVCMWLMYLVGMSMVCASVLMTLYFPPERQLEDPYGHRVGYSPILMLPISQHLKPDIRIS